ncbi:MAG: DegT/DnrJ/EryC1/StrS family aminotransferase [Ignavibacteriales bacterium]|nr:DegT/DnrJ/EryC1/StrS family aminotransferase [Ignavibacteriales bacterium]
MEKRNISVCEPFLNGNEKKYINEAIDTNWISSRGKFVDQFENIFAKYCEVNYAVTVSNGTNAIHLALKALGISTGDEIIIPDFTMICSVLPVVYLEAIPVFVDAEPETWNIDPQKIEDKISGKTKAIMVVHIYGHPCDMNPIREIANKYNLRIIEDAAEAHGAEYFGKKCGNLGDIAAFSFFSNKVVTTGEGGMVTTSNETYFEKSRYYKDLCFPLSGERTYFHEDIGFQYRLSNMQAAIGVAQMEKIDEYITMRRNNNKLYQELLHDVEGIQFQPENPGCKNIYWMNAITIDKDKFGFARNNLIEQLLDSGIQTRKFFFPMHKQPCLQNYKDYNNGDFPVSNYLSENGMYLPSSSNLKRDEIEYISEKIRKIWNSK